mmetsp:Transcript_33406/g.34039  ORF Transcript_33406/g.34039 Transcript_33406/m.34039 type:complete len:104 (+) Transcript_33406:136-447(+)
MVIPLSILISLTWIYTSSCFCRTLPTELIPLFSRKYKEMMSASASLKMSLEMTEVVIPLQNNPNDYIVKLKEIIPEHLILRWYICKVQDGCVIIEVVSDVPSN